MKLEKDDHPPNAKTCKTCTQNFRLKIVNPCMTCTRNDKVFHDDPTELLTDNYEPQTPDFPYHETLINIAELANRVLHEVEIYRRGERSHDLANKHFMNIKTAASKIIWAIHVPLGSKLHEGLANGVLDETVADIKKLLDGW